MPVSELPPRTPSRSASRAPVGFRRALSTGPTGMQQHSPNRRGAAVPPLTRSESQGRDSIDSSHLDGLYFEQEQQHQQWQQQRRPEERFVPSYPSQKVGIVDDFDYDSGDGAADEVERPLPRHGEYSAEEIALRRFMTTVAWGSGLAVVKHNRGKGRGRRLLKFNDEVRFQRKKREVGNLLVLSFFRSACSTPAGTFI